MLEKVLGPLAERWRWLRTALCVKERFDEVHGNYLASAIALAAFLSIFPLLLVLTAVVGFFSSGSPGLADDVIAELGVTGTAANAMKSAFRAAERSRETASVIGFVGLLWSGLGLVAALQYAYNQVWQVQGRGVRDKLVGLGWLSGAGAILLASFGLTAVVAWLPAVLKPLGVVVGVAVGAALFLWTNKVLPNRHLDWKRLVPGAVLGGIGLEVLKAVGAFYVPKLVSSSSALYGSIGTVFALLAWLFIFAQMIVYTAILNVVRWEEEFGTVRVEIEVPRVPYAVPVEASRSGEAKPSTPAPSPT